MSGLALAAGGTLAMPRVLTSALLPRVLGLYIAGCAGTVQLLDILVDRLQLDDRIFTFAIIVAVVGIPFAAAGAVLADTARGEKRRPDTRHDGERERNVRAPLREGGERAGPPEGSAPGAPREAAVVQPAARGRSDDDAERLHRRLDVVLSWHRIGALAEESGSAEEAAAHRQRAHAEIEALIADLRQLPATAAPGYRPQRADSETER